MAQIQSLHAIMEFFAIAQIKYAKEKGMTVIVTDHHDIPFDFVDGEKIHKSTAGRCNR